MCCHKSLLPPGPTWLVGTQVSESGAQIEDRVVYKHSRVLRHLQQWYQQYRQFWVPCAPVPPLTQQLSTGWLTSNGSLLSRGASGACCPPTASSPTLSRLIEKSDSSLSVRRTTLGLHAGAATRAPNEPWRPQRASQPANQAVNQPGRQANKLQRLLLAPAAHLLRSTGG